MKYYNRRRRYVRIMKGYFSLVLSVILGLVIGRLIVCAKGYDDSYDKIIYVEAEPITPYDIKSDNIIVDTQDEQIIQSDSQIEVSDSDLLCPEDNDEIEVDMLDNVDILSIDDIVIDINNVAAISNATEDMIESALEGTWLEGYGSLYYELEHEYNVNAFLAIGNAIQETGWDETKSYLARNHNNIYGITNGTFDSKEDCIRYYFRLINKHYIGEGYISLEQINGKYCPPDDTWDNDIYSIAKKLKSKVDITPK